MKHKHWLFLCVLTTGAFALEASAEPAAEPKSVDGGVMAEQIRNHIAGEGFSPLTKVDVQADDTGTVTLKGMAASDAEAARVVALAKEVNGVMAVQSEILIKRTQ